MKQHESVNLDDAPVIPGGIYKHYKGDYYLVLHAATDSENVANRGSLVVYMSLDGPQTGHIRVRSLAEFRDTVEKPGGGTTPRFKHIRTAPR